MNSYYDRYNKFRENNIIKVVPFISMPIETNDIYITYNKNTMRMDTLSYKYYNDPNYGWLIMQSNPEYGSMEYSIPDGVTLRIPYPLSSAINRYEEGINKYYNENI